MFVLLHWWILESVIMTSLHGNNNTIEIKVFECLRDTFGRGLKAFIASEWQRNHVGKKIVRYMYSSFLEIV